MTTETDGSGTTTTDDAAAAAAAAAAANANQTNQSSDASGANGSTTEDTNADPFAALSEDTRKWFEAKHGKDASKAVAQAYELEKLRGKSIVIPDENSTPEQIADFSKKMGVPESADKYGFEVPKDLPPELPYDGDQDKAFAQTAHELKLSAAQAKGVRDWFIKSQVSAIGSQSEGLRESLKSTIKAETDKLVADWGPMDGETFKANVEFADRFFTAVDKDGELKAAVTKAGWLGPNGEVLNKALASAFANAGRALYMEDGQLRGNATQLDNPFAPGTFNLTKIGQLVKSDPQKARAFAKAAGVKPETYGLPAN